MSYAATVAAAAESYAAAAAAAAAESLSAESAATVAAAAAAAAAAVESYAAEHKKNTLAYLGLGYFLDWISRQSQCSNCYVESEQSQQCDYGSSHYPEPRNWQDHYSRCKSHRSQWCGLSQSSWQSLDGKHSQCERTYQSDRSECSCRPLRLCLLGDLPNN